MYSLYRLNINGAALLHKAFTQPHDFQHFFNDFMVCDVKTKQTKQLLTVTIRDLQKGKCYRKTILEFIEV